MIKRKYRIRTELLSDGEIGYIAETVEYDIDSIERAEERLNEINEEIKQLEAIEYDENVPLSINHKYNKALIKIPILRKDRFEYAETIVKVKNDWQPIRGVLYDTTIELAKQVIKEAKSYYKEKDNYKETIVYEE